ncbi:hypothetical protein V500_00742 [Pseudogymnoascus sp. VKM F-4518 (FW-2643)]|nr:hypothetical protein V500_00742 [Pseudogymnoascus sp. VKM F-4518 (FW-2643)]
MSLIKDPRTLSLWETAQSRPEWGATRFWEYVFKESIFVGRDWAISSQQPPTNNQGDRRRVDLCIERWIRDSWQKIAVFEAKKANCSQAEIDTVEFQAYEACMAHLLDSGREQMYGMTTIGTRARIWYVTKDDDYLLPMVPATVGLSDRPAYIDAHSSQALDLKKGFDYIVKNDMMSDKRLQVLRSNRSPRPSQPPANIPYFGPATQLTYGIAMQPSSVPSNPTGFMSPNPQAQFQSNMDTPPQPVYGSRPLPGTLNTPLLYSTTPQAYTVPAVQDNQDNHGDEEVEDGDNTMESPGPVAELESGTAEYVEVTRKVVRHTLRDDEVFFCFQGRQTTRTQWRKSTVMYQDGIVRCMVYTSQKGTQYYTYALPKGKGKGKA